MMQAGAGTDGVAMTPNKAGDGDGATAADRAAFDRIARERRTEIKVHCYRVMGSLSEAEDLTQETLARAWRARGELADQAALRPWLYRIATNACLDALRRRKRERRLWGDPVPMPTGDVAELGTPDLDGAWLEPLPETAMAGVADEAPCPQASYEQAEAVRLAFLACVQRLPPRQRAIFLLREVLGWSAADVAAAFAMTPQAVNSLLQRARRAFGTAYEQQPQWAAATDLDQAAAERYAAALERRDLDAFVALLHADATLRMPPWRAWLRGRDAIRRFMGQGLNRWGEFRGTVVRANGRRAVALYVATGDGAWQPQSLHVLELADTAIASIVAFVGPSAPALFAAAGLPMRPGDLPCRVRGG